MEEIHIPFSFKKFIKSFSHKQIYNLKSINHLIYTTPNDFNQYCEELKQRFNNEGYKPEVIDNRA